MTESKIECNDAQEAAFLRGVAVALSTLVRCTHNYDAAAIVIREMGLTGTTVSGLTAYDRDNLRKVAEYMRPEGYFGTDHPDCILVPLG